MATLFGGLFPAQPIAAAREWARGLNLQVETPSTGDRFGTQRDHTKEEQRPRNPPLQTKIVPRPSVVGEGEEERSAPQTRAFHWGFGQIGLTGIDI